MLPSNTEVSQPMPQSRDPRQQSAIFKRHQRHQQRLRALRQCMSQGKTLFGLDVWHKGHEKPSLIRFADCGPKGHPPAVVCVRTSREANLALPPEALGRFVEVYQGPAAG